jgi:hypothetical protein
MVQPLDFTLGIVVGTVIGVIVGFVANYLTEMFRERKRCEHVINAFIRELTTINDNIRGGEPYKSAVVGTPVFDKLITELPLLREIVAEELLLIYSDIKFLLRVPALGAITDELEALTKDIDVDIKMLKGEIKRKQKWLKLP